MARKREERAAKSCSQKKDAKRGDSKLSGDEQNYTMFTTQLSAMGLMQREIPGDGNCLFRALGDQMEGHARKHLQHRQDTVEYMRQHRKDFEPFIEDNVPFDSYVNNLEKPGTYAGNDAIVAFARKHMVTVVIHQLNSPLWRVHGGEANKPIRELHVAYHNGDHYNSIRRIGDFSENPASVKLGSDVPSIPAADAQGYYKKFYEKTLYENSSSEEEDESDLVQLVMDRSGCEDRTMAEQSLEDNFFDVELTVESLINLLLRSQGKENEKTDGISYISSQNHGLWAPHGTGSRLFGSDPSFITDDSTSSTGGVRQKFPKPATNPTTNPKKHLSNKQQKELKRRERKLRSDVRKKQADTSKEYSNLGDNFHAVLVQKLGCVNI